MASPRARLTTAEEVAARRAADKNAGGSGKERSEEEKAQRKERVEKAKDALSRSVGMKGDHVASARAALKDFLRRLNEPRQPSDDQFEAMIEAPFKAPPKKDRGFGGGRG
jgi:hypothetical protein